MPIEFAEDTEQWQALPKPDSLKWTQPPDFTRAEGDDDKQFIIEGFASTPDIDEFNEVVEPEAFRKFLPRFKEFPIVLRMHDFWGMPVGMVLEAEIRPGGLWVKVLVSDTAPDIQALIKEGILKAFSVGFRGKISERDSAEGARPDTTWKEVELVELSIVSIPANRRALFEQASKKGVDLSECYRRAGHTPPDTGQEAEEEKGIMPDILTLTPEEVGSVATKAADTACTALDVRFKATLDERAAEIETEKGDIREKFALCQTKAETEALIEKVKAEFMPVLKHFQRLEDPAPERREIIHTANQATKMAAMGVLTKGVAAEFKKHPTFMRHILNDPEDLYQKGDDRFGITQQLQQSNDCLLILHSMAKASLGTAYEGIKSLQYWDVYSKVEAEFRKAMDTATATEGTEWIPTNFSSDLIKLIQQLGNLSALFPHFPMPTKVFEWPIQVGRATAYLVAESLSDSSTSIPASTPTTGNTTFTAKKLAARVLTSGEFIEDSIIAVLPFIREEIANQFMRAEEDAIYNGDTATPHMDSGVTAATDHRKAWIGLRGYAIDQSDTSDTGAFALADLRTIRGLLGNYGVNPANLAYILSPGIYITKFLVDSDITTMEKAGARATWLTGEKESIDGARVRVSEFVQDTLNASGVQDGVTETKSTVACVYMPGWKMGTRRTVTIKSEEIIDTDQMKTVGTMREDFEPMYGTDAIVGLGYNVA